MPCFPDDVPHLTDGTVTLRAHGGADVPRIVEFANDPQSRRWVPLPLPYGKDRAQEFLEDVAKGWADGTSHTWAVETGGEFAGSVDLRFHHTGVAEVGYGAHPDSRGRGVMTRAVRLVVAHGFGVLGLRTIVWRAAVGNFASRRVAWANGFRVDGRWPAMHEAAAGRVDDVWLGHLHAGDLPEPPHPWWVPPVLEGDGIRLREWRDDDPPEAPDATAEHFTEGMWTAPADYPIWHRERLDRMASGEGVFWCIADAGSDRPLGHVQVIRLHLEFTRGTGLLGYWAIPAARGTGLVQRALDVLIPHAFTPREDGGLGLHRLQAGTDAANRASQRTLRRAGFQVCGTQREVLAHPVGPPTGALTFELLGTDDRSATRVTPHPVPVLRTDRLVLREWGERDRPRPDQRLDLASALFMPAGAQPTTDTFDEWLRRRRSLHDTGTAVTWCVVDRTSDHALGSIGVFGIGEGTPTNAEIGYWLHTGARGHGYGTEAIAAVVTHAFTGPAEGGMGLTRLHAGTDLENHPSQQVLERAGFARWGTDRQAYARADGSYSDGAYYELLATDLRD